jgi:hypothetical protein
MDILALVLPILLVASQYMMLPRKDCADCN